MGEGVAEQPQSSQMHPYHAIKAVFKALRSGSIITIGESIFGCQSAAGQGSEAYYVHLPCRRRRGWPLGGHSSRCCSSTGSHTSHRVPRVPRQWLASTRFSPLESSADFQVGRLACCTLYKGHALGASDADRDRLVVNLQGHGSACFHIAELDTYPRFSSRVLTAVMNNHCWGMGLHEQELMYGYLTGEARPVARLSP